MGAAPMGGLPLLVLPLFFRLGSGANAEESLKKDCLFCGRFSIGDQVVFCDSIADLFAAQLAKVISIHHRHMSDSSWSGWETEDDDASGGMAA